MAHARQQAQPPRRVLVDLGRNTERGLVALRRPVPVPSPTVVVERLEVQVDVEVALPEPARQAAKEPVRVPGGAAHDAPLGPMHSADHRSTSARSSPGVRLVRDAGAGRGSEAGQLSASVHPDPVQDHVEPGVGSPNLCVRRLSTIDVDEDAEASVVWLVSKTSGHASTVGNQNREQPRMRYLGARRDQGGH